MELLNALELDGLTASPNTGHVSAVRFHNAHNDYLLSFIVNPAHLLFYLRVPVLRKARDLSKLAVDNHLGRTNVNNAGETTVRVETRSDAQKLLSWLRPRIAGLS